MIIGIPTPLPPSIKPCQFPLQASSQESSEPYATRALIHSLKAKSKQGDYCRDIRRERLVLSPIGFFETCSAGDPPKENSTSELGCILLWLINDKRLLVMVPLLLMIMIMSYVFSDWHIVAYTGFYACVCCVSCVYRCPVTKIVRIVICHS